MSAGDPKRTSAPHAHHPFKVLVSISLARIGMLERLGNALYWLGCILAAILIAVSVYVFATDATGLGIAMSIAYALTAVVVWLLGWVFRYVLSGS